METRKSDICVALLREAAQRAELIERMRSFYEETDRLIAEYSATCWNRGQCCAFSQYGHRLYVTALETAYYLSAGEPLPQITEDACPHASGGKCHVRDRRPLGCRIYYCDPKAHDWQGPLTEERLGRLRTLHMQLDVPYFYADWIVVLKALSGHT